MKPSRIFAVICAITLMLTQTGCSGNTTGTEEPAKYVFLFIGDGMGTSHVDVTESYLSYKAGKLGGEQLLMTQFPVFGTCTTHSADRLITDSSAAGTAIACGEKTNNGWLGVDPEKNPLESVASVLKKDGYKVGIISSVAINHATPASFYGHNASRSAYYEITKEIPASGFEYFASSGFLSYFGNDGNEESSAEWLEQNGYNVCFGKAELAEAMKTDDRIVFVQEYNKDVEPKNYDTTGNKPESETTLAEMVAAGIEFLGDDEPFFIACEGGEIDWAAHSNRTMPTVMATIGFDDAIAVAYEFYQAHPDETLIVVTADHETGGIAVGGGFHRSTINWEAIEKSWIENGNSNNLDFMKNRELNTKGHIGWTTTDHTGGAVPVYAIGKGAEKFGGRMDNTDIKDKILCK